MARVLEVSGCHDVLGAFAWGTLPFAQTLHSLHLFAEEVMPAFSWGYWVADVEGGEGSCADSIVHIRGEESRIYPSITSDDAEILNRQVWI